MKLTIERAALLKALAHVQSVVERRNTIPILSNALIEARDGALRVTATDMDLAVVETVPATVSQPGETTVPAHTLYDMVRKLPEGAQIEIGSGSEEGRVELRAGRSRLALAALPAADFPVTTEGDTPTSFTLTAAELRTLIDRTQFAVSTEETRYYLNGIYIHATEADEGGAAVLRAVATDGHRLARVEIPLPDGAAGMPGVIVPRKTVTELRKLIEEDGEVAVSLSETKIRFALGDVVLTSKLIDGTFPDYRRVIPATNDKKLEVECGEFAHAVDLVSTISTDKSRAVKLTIGKGSLMLSATSPDAGSATEELEVGYSDDALEIGFNSRYLLDIARQIGGKAEFMLADAASPTLVRDASDPSAIYVLMPMRV